MNVRLSFLLVAVLLIFGGTFLVFQFRPSPSVSSDRPWLYRIDESTITHIEVSFSGETVNYDRKPGSNNWVIQRETEDVPVSLQRWSGTPLLLSGPQVSRVLAAEIDDPATYGLEPAESVVKVTERSGRTYEFRMGSTTPDGKHQYASLVGSPQLFTVPEVWAMVINRLAIEPPYQRLYDIGAYETLVHVGIDHNGQIVDYERRPGTEGWYVIGDDDEGPVAEAEWGKIFPLLISPPIAYALEDADDDASTYGLEPPPTAVRVTLGGGEFVDFYLGNTTEDGQERYASIRGQPDFFTVPEDWAKLLIELATQPPYTETVREPPNSG